MLNSEWLYPEEKPSGWRAHFAVRDGLKTALIAALLLAVVVLMIQQQPEPVPPVNLSVPAKPAPEVKHEPKVSKPLKTKTVKAYRQEVKKELKLPEVVQDDPALDVIASHQVKPDDHPQTVTTLLNTETGESETYVKRDPLPWFARDDRGEVGIALVLHNGEPVVRADGRQGLFQVKAVHVGAIGSVARDLNGGGDTEWEIGLRAWYGW